jgi:hypothetical protein
VGRRRCGGEGKRGSDEGEVLLQSELLFQSEVLEGRHGREVCGLQGRSERFWFEEGRG